MQKVFFPVFVVKPAESKNQLTCQPQLLTSLQLFQVFKILG
jgi:hypothetical protein